MPRHSAGGLTTAGSTLLPIAALTAAASVGCKLVEVGVFNTTATAVALKLVRLTTAGTPGATLTSAAHEINAVASSCLLKNTYSSTGPTLVDLGYRTVLGAAVGSATIWTFKGIEIDAGTANGIGIVVENGTGQACQVYFVWDE